jgi:hypothetical protein
MTSAGTSRVGNNGNSYTPPTPFQASWKSVMSQDVVGTTNILVDSTSSSPVAVFVNPKTSETEALVISNVGNAGRQLCHVARDLGTDGGWTLTPLFGGTQATQAAAGTAYADTSSATLYGFYIGDTGLNVTQLQADGSTWSSPQSIAGGDSSNLRVAYSPHGRLVLYGSNAAGDLVTAYQTAIDGPFTMTVCAMKGALAQGDFQLCMTDDSTWSTAANVNGKPYLFTGEIDQAKYSAMEQVTQFTGTLEQIVLGYWSDQQNTLMYLLVDDDHALHVWASNDANSVTVARPIPNSKVVSATGHVDEQGSLNVYSIDDDQGLWVLHQSARNPWNDDGTPNWAPYIAIDKGVAAVVGDANPADVPALFALDAADFSLRFHAQDTLTSMWMSGAVLQASAQSFEVVRFRTEINLIDANGNPLPHQPITVSVADGDSASELWVAGTIYPVNSETEVQLATDATGKLTIAVLTTAGMVTPSLVLNTAGLAKPITIQPSEPVHNYLSGRGTLNPTNPGGQLPVFDAAGGTLATATLHGKPLAPGAQSNSTLAGTAASAIRNTALVGLGTPPLGIAGYAGSFGGTSGVEFTVFRTPAELQAHLALVRGGTAGELEGFLDEISDFFGDVWEGIKNGIIAMSDFVVDIATKIANFTLQIGQEIAQGINLALKGLEQAAHFIAGVFSAVAAAIDNVIDWLKALFDFAAIWRTKMALEQALLAAPAYIKALAQLGEKAADGWFSKQKDQVDAAFAAIEKSYAGQTFGGQTNWQQPGSGPSNQQIAGGASPADFTNNVHHNWLQDKVSSYSPEHDGIGPDNSLHDPWVNFTAHVDASAGDFRDACVDFSKAVIDTIQDPKSFGTVGLPYLLESVNKLVDAVLLLCDAIVDAFMAIAELAMDSLETLFNTELDLGFLNTFWEWVATSAGYPDDSKLTMAALISLMAAFPCTVIYKLIDGVDNEPFPTGQFPIGQEFEMVAGGPAFGIAMPRGCLLSSAIMQIIYVVPAGISDFLGNNAPWWITAITIGFSIVIWALAHGYPDLSGLEWAITAAVVGNLLWIAPAVYFVVQSVAAAFLKKVTDNFGDIADVMTTVYGVLKFILATVLDFVTTVNPGQAVANILLPLPPIFGFCNMSTFRDDPDVAPFAIAANLIFDFIGYIGGGVIEIVEVVASQQPGLPAPTS